MNLEIISILKTPLNVKTKLGAALARINYLENLMIEHPEEINNEANIILHNRKLAEGLLRDVKP